MEHLHVLKIGNCIMRTLFVILMLSSAAHADCLQWGRDQHGTRVCMTDDSVNHNPVFPEVGQIPCGFVMGCGNVTISNAPQPKCDDGWTLVSDLSMHPMCARELRNPK